MEAVRDSQTRHLPDRPVHHIAAARHHEADVLCTLEHLGGSFDEILRSFLEGDSSEEGNHLVLDSPFDFEILKELDRIMKKRNIYIWCNKLLIPKLFEYYKGSLFDIISWHKTNAMPLCGSKYLTDTEYCLYFHDTMKLNTTYDTAKTHYEQPINVKDKQKYGHPTCKPINILENLIINSSNEGDIVFDAFAGSGSTLVAAKNQNRQYLGFEIDPKWAQIASDRLNNIDATGQISLFTF